jgi:hypothetical protein
VARATGGLAAEIRRIGVSTSVAAIRVSEAHFTARARAGTILASASACPSAKPEGVSALHEEQT